MKTIAISATTIIIILLVTFSIAWKYRGRIYQSLATGYSQSLASNNPNPQVFSSETLVVNAVQSANPAVVAISISKNVPKYKTTYNQVNPFGDMFDGFMFNMPTQTPDGYEKKDIGGGSGFIVSADGLIVTNKHVVADKDADYTVYLSNGKKYTAKVLARDAVLDVALVKIEALGLPYLSLGNSDNIKLGQTAIAIGNALAQFQNTVSVGVISGLSRSITAGDGAGSSESLDHVIQTDAAINPGNSGGPLLDLNGRVIGINTAIVSGSENIGFALPINSVKTAIDSVRATGKIVRPYIGIRYQMITPEMKTANNLTVDYGALVKAGQSTNDLAVIPGSPADKAGIVENDIILEVNGTKVDSDYNLSQTVRESKVGDTLKLKLLSKGKEKTVTVTLEAAPQE